MTSVRGAGWPSWDKFRTTPAIAPPSDAAVSIADSSAASRLEVSNK
jgi:hypothetical protein